MIFCIRLPNFVQIGAPTAEIWRHIHFWIWQPRPLSTTSGFVFFDVTAFRRWKLISISIWDITISGFEIQTSATLEFYFRFRSRPVRRNLYVILHQATEFRPNRITHCGNITSYPFLKMAAVTAKYYFRFPTCWCRCLQNVNVYQQTPCLSANQLPSRYLFWRLKYKYFRFRSRNVHHIGILLPVSISTSSP